MRASASLSGSPACLGPHDESGMVRQLYNCLNFFLGKTYKYVADSCSIVDFYNSSKSHYESYPELGLIDEKFEDFLVETYSKCASINCINNDFKSNNIYLMQRTVLLMFAVCALGGLVVISSSIVNGSF